MELSGRDLHAISLGVENHAFVVPVTRSAGSTDNDDPSLAKTSSKLVHGLLGAKGYRNVRQSHAFSPVLHRDWRERRRSHDLEPRPGFKGEKARCESLGLVLVERPHLRAKVLRIEAADRIQVRNPQCYVMQVRHVAVT